MTTTITRFGPRRLLFRFGRSRAIGLLALAGLAAVLLLVETPSHAAQPEQPPNVLMILVDDLGYGDLSCYGAKDLQTPSIDRLVSRGMNLPEFYANCPVCSPTRASLLTGRFPDCVGVPGVIRTHDKHSWGYLDPNTPLLPELLRRAGYTTAMVGKWHLGLEQPNLPNLRGFDFFHGFLGDMMDDYYHHRRHGVNYMRLNREMIAPKGHATDLFTQWTCEWLSNYQAAAPFFLYLAYNAPHSPIQPPENWLERYRERYPNVEPKRAKLAALVEHLDAGIGRVLDCLQKSGHAERTLIIFSSDNGGAEYFGSDNGPLAGGKQEMLEGGIRVPTCVVWPGHIKPGTTSRRVAMTMDLFPTICDAAGVQPPAGLESISMLPALLGKQQPDDERTLFWVRLEGGRKYHGQPYYAARRGPWKLFQNTPDEPLRLVNLEKDPEETTDVSAKNAEVFAKLKEALEQHRERCASVSWKRPE